MGIILSSISGGVADPYAGDGATPPSQQFPNAVEDGNSFSDRIDVDLTYDPTPFTQIKSVVVTTSQSGNAQSLNNLTGGEPLNDITYTAPELQPNTLSSLSITTTIAAGNTTANVFITGTLSGTFPDKFWGYKNTITYETATTNAVGNIPAENARLYLHKPSFMNFVSVYFTVTVEYDTANIVYVCEKRVINNWETGRLALKNRLASEN